MAYYTRDDIIDTLTKRVDLLGELRAHHQAKSELHRSLTNFRNDVHGTYHGHGGMGNPANHSKLLPVEAAYGAAQEYLDRRIEKLEAMMARADEEHRVACERCKEAVRRGRERGASAADGTTSDECTTDETTQDESTTASMTEREDSPQTQGPSSTREGRDARVQRWVREHDDADLRPQLPSHVWM